MPRGEMMEPMDTLVREALALASPKTQTIGIRLAEAEIAAIGFTQVIAVLHPATLPPPDSFAAAAATHPELAALQKLIRGKRSPLADVVRHFIVPPASQDAMLAFGHSETAAAMASASAPDVPAAHVYPNLGVVLGNVDLTGLAALIADERVREVQPAPQFSLIRPTRVALAAKTSGISWGLSRMRIPEMWDAGFTGEGVLVGHLDTGVDASHPALKGAIAQFAEFDEMGRQVPNASPHDTHLHGTHTAGTIAGRKIGPTNFGVAPDAQLASAIVIEGGNIVARILAGMDWAVARNIRILNMSLGLRGYTPAFLTLTQQLRRQGILPVFAVGNEGAGTSRSPGNYVEALSVGAHGADDTVASFSGSQRFARTDDPLVPDVVAPGVAVLSCIPNGKYAELDGSSMGTPHVSGLAALLLQAKPGATVDELEQAIFGACARPASMPEDRANRGVPDGPRAYELLTGKTLPPGGDAATSVKPRRKPLGPKHKNRRSGTTARDRQSKKRHGGR